MGAVCDAVASEICETDEVRVRGGQEVYEPAGPEIPEPPLPGRWLSARGNQHVIGLEAVQWASGENTPFRKVPQPRMRKGSAKKPTQWILELDGNRYTFQYNMDGNLVWSDGDVWTRDQRPPATGTYQAMTGVFARAGESFHQTFEGTPTALSSAAALVTTPLSKFGGAGSDTGSPTQVAAVPASAPAIMEEAPPPVYTTPHPAASPSGGSQCSSHGAVVTVMDASGPEAALQYHQPLPGQTYMPHGAAGPAPTSTQAFHLSQQALNAEAVSPQGPRPKRRAAPSPGPNASRG